MHYSLFVLLLGILLASPVRAFAIDGSSPAPGSRVRILVPCALMTPSGQGDCQLTGRLDRWAPDSLTLAESETTTPFALADLKRLQVSEGQRSYKFLGAGVGAVIGAGLTYLILNSGGSTALCNQSENQDAMNSSECVGLYALGGLGGAGIGFLIGGMIHSERWQDVQLQK